MYTELAKADYLDSWVTQTRYFTLPTTIQLLSQGGDARISVTEQGINKYGCTPYSDPSLVAFGSSTASVISDHGFEAADELRNKLLRALEDEQPEAVYAHELNRIRRELITLCDLKSMSDLEVIFGASGTDLHLIAAQLANGLNTKPTMVIMPETTETGSGVAAALASRHFSNRSALGKNVIEGSKVRNASAVELVSIEMRHANGELRAEESIDAEVETLVEQAVQMGQHVLLILVDTSKTGLISPSINCAISLKQRYQHLVDVLVDACQFRISNSTLRAYLKHEFMLIVTGSKFLTGPVFSGALLLPGTVAQRLLSQPIASGLADYSARAEWPGQCMASSSLNDKTNFGLLLRWEAALEEMRRFRSIPEKQIRNFSQSFSEAIQKRLSVNAHIGLIPARELDRSALFDQQDNNDNWDSLPTIFSFMLYRKGSNGLRTPLTHEETQKVYQWLQLDQTNSDRPKNMNTNLHIMRS